MHIDTMNMCVSEYCISLHIVLQPLSLCIASITGYCKVLLSFTFLFSGEISAASSKALNILSCNLNSVVCVRVQ